MYQTQQLLLCYVIV